MIVKNLTQKTIISSNLIELKSELDKLLGLFKKYSSRSLLFRTRFGIHTFGLKESIDVIILDENKIVVKLAEVKPNSLFFWNPKYSLVLELPKGTIKKSKTKLSDLINF